MPEGVHLTQVSLYLILVKCMGQELDITEIPFQNFFIMFFQSLGLGGFVVDPTEFVEYLLIPHNKVCKLLQAYFKGQLLSQCIASLVPIY